MSNCRLGLAFALALSVTACKIQIVVPEGGRVVGQSLTCPASTVCDVEVTDTSFDQTYRAVPGSDRFTFTGWKEASRYFCGGNAKPCRLTTKLFGDNAALLAFLDADDEIFYLSPNFEELSDNLPSGAQPISLATDSVIRGQLGGRKVSYDEDSFFGAPIDGSDYFVFVAPSTGEVSIRLDKLDVDYDLSLESSRGIIEISESIGPKAESITARVTEGSTYYINVFPYDESRGNYELSVGFDPFRPADTPSDISGTYAIESSDAFGFCLMDGPFIIEGPTGELLVQKNGQFTEFVNGSMESDELRVHRQYSNDVAAGTVVRRDAYKFLDNDDLPIFVIEMLITAEFFEGGLQGERFERFVLFNTDGSKLDDCITSWSFIGRRVANPDDSGDKELSP